eukprot:Nk52_evm84s215 gene=Nk52_evmTU84s215
MSERRSVDETGNGRPQSFSEDEVLLNTLAMQTEKSLEQKRLSRKEARKSLMSDEQPSGSDASSKVSVETTFVEEIWDPAMLQELPVRARKRFEAIREQMKDVLKSKLEVEQEKRMLGYEIEILKNKVEDYHNSELQLTYELRKSTDLLRNVQALGEKKDLEFRELKLKFEETYEMLKELQGAQTASEANSLPTLTIESGKELELKCQELSATNERLKEQLLILGSATDGDISTKLKLIEKHLGEKLTFYVRENVRLKKQLQEAEGALSQMKAHEAISKDLQRESSSQFSLNDVEEDNRNLRKEIRSLLSVLDHYKIDLRSQAALRYFDSTSSLTGSQNSL